MYPNIALMISGFFNTVTEVNPFLWGAAIIVILPVLGTMLVQVIVAIKGNAIANESRQVLTQQTQIADKTERVLTASQETAALTLEKLDKQGSVQGEIHTAVNSNFSKLEERQVMAEQKLADALAKIQELTEQQLQSALERVKELERRDDVVNGKR